MSWFCQYHIRAKFFQKSHLNCYIGYLSQMFQRKTPNLKYKKNSNEIFKKRLIPDVWNTHRKFLLSSWVSSSRGSSLPANRKRAQKGIKVYASSISWVQQLTTSKDIRYLILSVQTRWPIFFNNFFLSMRKKFKNK